MSLRQDLHAAYDEVMPETTGMAERALQAVAAGRPRTITLRTRRALRVPLSLVAALLLLALLVGLLIGGRLLHDSNTVPAGQVDPARVHQLEGVALNLPAIGASSPCPSNQFDESTGWWGPGPVYFFSEVASGYGAPATTSWGAYFPFVAEVPTLEHGALLLRGRNLVTGQPILFVGTYAVGPVAGTDTLNGESVQQHVELALDAGRPRTAPNNGFIPWALTFGISTSGLSKSQSGALTLPPSFCVGIQIDGAGWTEVVLISL